MVLAFDDHIGRRGGAGLGPQPSEPVVAITDDLSPQNVRCDVVAIEGERLLPSLNVHTAERRIVTTDAFRTSIALCAFLGTEDRGVDTDADWDYIFVQAPRT